MKRLLVLAGILAVSGGASFAAAPAPAHWIGTWGAPPAVTSPASPSFENQTIRQVLRLSAGGSRVRVRLSNEYGATPLVIGAATIAKAGDGSDLAGPAVPLTFGGATSVTIPVGAPILSDPVALPVAALSSVSVSLFLPEKTGPCTCHPQGTATAYLSPPGDFTDQAFTPVPYVPPARGGAGGAGAAPPAGGPVAASANGAAAPANGTAAAAGAAATAPANGPAAAAAGGGGRGGAGRGPASLTQRAFVTEIEVDAPASAKTIITFGDSITDGTRSTNDKNARWHDVLAERLNAPAKAAKSAAQGAAKPAAHATWGVVNEAISGNQILKLGSVGFGDPALKRFDRDVLSVPGTAYMTVLEGINDLGMNPTGRPTADQLIAGYRQIIDRAHAHGIKVYGITLMPFEGASYYTPEGDAIRDTVNAWIRTSHAFDAVIDFDALMRDPANPKRLKADLQSGDWLHPNDTGYKLMGDSVDLKLFR